MRVRAWIVLACVVVAFGGGSARAANGTYKQMLCADPATGLGVAANGVLPPGLSVTAVGNGAYANTNSSVSCGPGPITNTRGILLDSGTSGYTTNIPGNGIGALAYRPPAGTSIVHVNLAMAAYLITADYHETVTVHGGDPNDIWAGPGFLGCEWDLGCAGFGTIAAPFDPQNMHYWDAAPPDGFAITMGCTLPDSGWTCYAEGQFAVLYGAEVTLHDQYNPVASSTAIGGLTSDDPLKGTEDATVNGTDVGSGLYRALTLVDGQVVQARAVDPNGGLCVDVDPSNSDPYEFASGQPCKPIAGATLEFNTQSVPDGRHNFKVQLEDAAGNVTTVVDRSVNVLNNPISTTQSVHPAPSSPAATPGGSGTGAPSADAPAAGPNGVNGGATVLLTTARGRVLRLHHGQSVTLRGHLTTAMGAPVSGAKIDVLQARHTGLQVTTAADGGFAYVVPAGVSRTIRIGYRASLGDASFARTLRVRIRVRAAVTFRLSTSHLRNGQTLFYSGSLLGPGNAGRFVDIEVHNGRSWQVICSLRTSKHGHFICGHHFTRTFAPTSYAFRAVVPPQNGLPYDPAHSRTLRVRVRP